MTHRHKWSRVGLWVNGEISRPCLVGNCPAELRQPWRGSLRRIIPDGYPSLDLPITDHPRGGVAKIIKREVLESYDLDRIDFEPGDVVIDIGAHVGVVSIYLAKKYPFLRILAFEPTPTNFKRLLWNIAQNKVTNVTPIHAAIVGQGRRFRLTYNDRTNTGGASGYIRGKRIRVPAMTLDEVFTTLWSTQGGTAYEVDRCKLLKVDCEGAEYDIFTGASEAILSRVDYLRGEFHTNQGLTRRGFAPYTLEEMLANYILPERIKFHTCRIAN